MSKQIKFILENTSTIRINKLRGRMLHLPAPKDKKRNILLIYGHHASIERMQGISQNLNKYGSITLPDLPGFGGMDNFYKIGLKPTLDNYADYLASFIKLRFKRKKITIVAMSFGFPLVVRMLQKYPETQSKIDLLVSTVGFVHKDDFRMPKWQQYALRITGRAFQGYLTSKIMRRLFLNSFVIRSSYKMLQSRHSKMKDAEDDKDLDERIRAEIKLWHTNDVRTRMFTMADMFTYDLCKKNVNIGVNHVSVENDRYFNNSIVEQHMRIIFNDFVDFPSSIPAHMPSIVATAEEADYFVPSKLKALLRSN